jgi:hypothetical protein
MQSSKRFKLPKTNKSSSIMKQAIIFILLLIPFILKAQVFAAPGSAPKTIVIGNIIRDEKLAAGVYCYFEDQSNELNSKTLKQDTRLK